MVMSHTRMCPITLAQEVAPSATLTSTKSSGNVSGNARSTNGYIKVEWWDATSDVYGAGAPGSNIAWSKAAGGAGEKVLNIYSCDASGNVTGDLTYLACASNSLTDIDLTDLTSLATLTANINSLTSLDLSSLTALTSVNVDGNSLTSLNVSGLTSLDFLGCSNNSLTSLDLSGLTALAALYCNNNPITSLRAVGVPGSAVYGSSGSYTSPYYDGVMIANNSLDGTALNQLYTDLADNTLAGGYALVFVGGNPGTGADDPSIATAKNWVVLAS